MPACPIRSAFYGSETPASIRETVLLYRTKWTKWHRQSTRYRDQQTKYQKGYMASWRAKRKAALEARS